MKGPRQSATTWMRVVRGLVGFRVASGPLFLWTYVADRRIAVVCLGVAGCLTDGLDGYIARRGGRVSGVGSYAGASADFVLVTSAFLAFVLSGLYPWWILLVIGGVFAQFILTSGPQGPLYDAVGKYYGIFLYGAVLLTLLAPIPDVRTAVLAGLLVLTIVAVGRRFLLLMRSR